MGKISVSISDDIEDELRRAGMDKFGMKKGYLSKAVEEAIEEWLEEESK